MTASLTRRLSALYFGLALYGVSLAVMIRADLGLDPWDVFHQGVTEHTGLSFGTVTAITGVVVLLIWIPLRQKPGLGTISNVIVIAVAVDAALAVLPTVESIPLRVTLMVAAVIVNAYATVLYIGAGLGPGPRDGLMTGFVARTGLSVRLVRTIIEVTVLTVGFFLGGSIGVGTVIYAFGIGPLVHLFASVFSSSDVTGALGQSKTNTVDPVIGTTVP